jgi:hypothetical protein
LFTEHWSDGGGDLADLLSLYAEDDDVDGADVCRIRSGDGRLCERLTAWRRKAEPPASYRGKMFATRDEGNVLASLYKPGAEKSACAADTVNRYSHAGRLSASCP